ncbi:MAG: rod shape-determining protein MreC [Sphingobacteriales bacterium]|nr:MAG: rod shape-determining protein MreC [Sphingobacteriales bacterium]
MGNIFAFFSKYHRFFLFLLLEIICLYLVVSFNHKQNSAYLALSSEVSGQLQTAYNNVDIYFHLNRVNDSLMAENKRLRDQLITSKIIDTTKASVVIDTTFKQRYIHIPGEIVNNSVTSRNNYLTLAIGKNKGVGPHLGVVSTVGIVGITRTSSNNFTSVLSVLHTDFTVSAEIKEIKEIGSVIWDGRNPSIVILKNIPMHIKISKGQHVVTSPYSNVFPQGTPIGIIQNFEVKSGDAFYTVYVKLATDMRNVRQAYVINDLVREEQEKVEETENENLKP